LCHIDGEHFAFGGVREWLKNFCGRKLAQLAAVDDRRYRNFRDHLVPIVADNKERIVGGIVGQRRAAVVE